MLSEPLTWPVGQGVKTSPSHGENTSSILVLAARNFRSDSEVFLFTRFYESFLYIVAFFYSLNKKPTPFTLMEKQVPINIVKFFFSKRCRSATAISVCPAAPLIRLYKYKVRILVFTGNLRKRSRLHLPQCFLQHFL